MPLILFLAKSILTVVKEIMGGEGLLEDHLLKEGGLAAGTINYRILRVEGPNREMIALSTHRPKFEQSLSRSKLVKN